MQTRHSQPPPDDEAEVESEIKEWRFPNQPTSHYDDDGGEDEEVEEEISATTSFGLGRTI